MYQRRPNCRGPREGKVVVLVAVSLVALLGVVAIALEGGLLFDHRRHVQASADAAALAAAESLFANYQQYQGKDTPGKAADAAAKASAAGNGYANDGVRSTVTTAIPPTTGPHANKDGYAEVTIVYNQPRYFSRIFGNTDLPVRGRAIARGSWSAAKMGILVLDLHEPESLKANGGGTITVANADLIVNSDDAGAVGSDGTGSLIKVVNANAALTGGLKSNATIDGTVLFNQRPTPDPLAYLPPPTMPSTAHTATKVNANSQQGKAYLTALNLNAKDVTQLYVLEPGRYDRLPNFTNGDVVILKQASANSQKGVYYLNGSGLVSTGATIVQDPTGGTTGGLMFYNDPQKANGGGDGIKITGGKVVLDAPSVPPYKGMLFWQRRDSDVPLEITGQGGMQLYGTFYTAGAPIKITGSNSTQLDIIGSQYISRTLQSGGNGSYKVDWIADKVAAQRLLGLVE